MPDPPCQHACVHTCLHAREIDVTRLSLSIQMLTKAHSLKGGFSETLKGGSMYEGGVFWVVDLFFFFFQLTLLAAGRHGVLTKFCLLTLE